MPEIGELSAIALGLEKRGKCALCGESHAEPKAEPPSEDPLFEQWARRQMGEPRNARLPGDELHHCVAYSAFMVGKAGSRRDVFAEVNLRLRAEGYDPNRHQNCAALPGSDETFQRRAGEGVPLQLHLGRHKAAPLVASKGMVLYLLHCIAGSPSRCMERSEEEAGDDLKTLIGKAEDFAFDRTLRYLEPFRLHHDRFEKTYANAKEFVDRWTSQDPLVNLDGNPFR